MSRALRRCCTWSTWRTAPGVNQPPTTSGIANENINVGDPEPLIDLFAAFEDVEDPDTALTYTIENNSNSALVTLTTIDGNQGTLTLTCATGATGSANITVRATDTGNPALFVETTFTLTVSPVTTQHSGHDSVAGFGKFR